MTIGPYTITRGQIIPFEESSTSEQSRIVTSDGGASISEDWDAAFKKCTIRVPRAEALNIQGFLRSAARYSAEAFELIDDYGTSWLVRYWDDKISGVVGASNLVEMVILFRVEVS